MENAHSNEIAMQTMTRKYVAVGGAAAVAAALIAVYFLGGNNQIVTPFQEQTASVNTIDTGPGIPIRLVIKSINVNAPVIKVGLTAQGAVDVPKGPSEVAWYQLGPRPGANGSSVITGHFGPWRDGSHSVFDNLNKLKVGDTIEVQDDKGAKRTFVVRQTKMYNGNESPAEVFNNNDDAHLNLITCQGEWLANQRTYTQRLVVFTDLVE